MTARCGICGKYQRLTKNGRFYKHREPVLPGPHCAGSGYYPEDTHGTPRKPKPATDAPDGGGG